MVITSNEVFESIICLKTFKDESGVDVSGDPMALQRLKEAAEKAKIELFFSSFHRDQSAVPHSRSVGP